MVGVKVSVNTRLAKARLKKYENKVAKQSFATMKDIKNLGKNYLQSVLPYDKGFLYRSVRGTVKEVAQGTQGTIWFDNADNYPNRTPSERFPQFNLVKWAAESPKASKHFNMSRRELKFMDRTRAYLRSKTGDKFRGDLKKIKF